jgi:DNA invertase Pin-like site-specific DNA recombinase
MKARHTKIVAYLRTSTDDQRLGIDAQQITLDRISRDREADIVRTYIEHESGGNCARPELDKAIRHARRIGAVVVVAKLDRLARDSRFLMQLYDGNVPMVFGDLPEIDGSAASRLMVQMMANIAEFERRRIGERTREALAALKAQGRVLGTPGNLTQQARVKGARLAATNRVARAVEEMADVAAVIAPMRAEGRSLRQIAAHLNEEGYVTRKGAAWTPTQVLRIARRSKGNGNGLPSPAPQGTPSTMPG